MKREEPLIRISKENRRFLVKPPHPVLQQSSNYQQAFKQEALLAQACRAPYFFTCLGTMEWKGQEVICYEYEVVTPLNKAVLEYAEMLKSEFDQVTNQLMEAVIYLHSQEVIHADIHPGNIYLTKAGCELRLVNCAQPYTALTPSCLLLRASYTPPERLADNELSDQTLPNQSTDIYAIGKVMEFLYSYSRVTVGINRVIKKATHADPAKRYATVQEMKRAFNQAKSWDWAIRGSKAAAAIGVMALCYYGLADQGPSKEELSFFEDSKIVHRKSVAEQDSLLQAASYLDLSESLMESITGAGSSATEGVINHSSDEAEIDQALTLNKEADERAAKLFKSQFRQAALPIIQRICTPQLMNGSQEHFQQESLDGFSALDKIQRELATELGLDLLNATTLASEIIGEVTQQSMQRLKREPTSSND
ncbi:MAG: protein kinase domain-containing protein [Phocaeicola sp.]